MCPILKRAEKMLVLVDESNCRYVVLSMLLVYFQIMGRGEA